MLEEGRQKNGSNSGCLWYFVALPVSRRCSVYGSYWRFWIVFFVWVCFGAKMSANEQANHLQKPHWRRLGPTETYGKNSRIAWFSLQHIYDSLQEIPLDPNDQIRIQFLIIFFKWLNSPCCIEYITPQYFIAWKVMLCWAAVLMVIHRCGASVGHQWHHCGS